MPALLAPRRAHSADALRRLAAADDAFALRMADAATVLWTRFHKYDAADPLWPDRDRFVLAAGRDAGLLDALLRLTGHDGTRLETQAGENLANGVGLALAERLMAARFGKSLVDHRTWVFCGAEALTDGLSQEAAALAGELRLHKLTVLHDAAGPDATRCFAAHGWATRVVDGGNASEIAAAIGFALRAQKPTLIACRRESAVLPAAHGRTSEHVAEIWHAAGARGAPTRRGWLKRLARHAKQPEFERVIAGRLPDGLHERTAGLKALFATVQQVTGQPGRSTGRASELAIESLAGPLPELLLCASQGGAPGCELAPVSAQHFAGQRLDCGARAHAMAAVMNGLALHGGIIPCGAATLRAGEAMRPALRLAAVARLRVIHVALDDGADGPLEHLASLRALPDLFVFRPADALEAAECWDLALRRADGPSLLALSSLPTAPASRDTAENRSARGGYLRALPEGARTPRHATLIATGFEVSLALAARALLAAEGIAVAVVSLPCWELFALQDESYRAAVLGTAPRFGIEAASGFGWERWLGTDGVFIGMAGYGTAGPADSLYRQFGMTPDAIAQRVKRRLGTVANQAGV